MRRVFAPLLLLLAAFGSAAEREIRYVITLNGSSVGESRTTIAGKEIKASTTISLGSRVEIEFAGTRGDGSYVSFAAKLTQGKTVVPATLTDGKIFVGAEAKAPISADRVKDGAYASFVPAVNWNLDARLDAALLKGRRTLDVLVFDSFTPATLKIGATRAVKTSAGAVTVRTVEIGALTLNLAFDADHEQIGLDVPAQKFRIVAEGFEGAFADPFAAFPELSPATFKTAQTSEWTPMRDGIKLRAEVIRPVTAGKVPTILLRTPYGRATSALASAWFAARGYAVVAQDVRGRGESEGEWDPMVNERGDGDDTVSWIAKQPWSDGKVGMIGASYGGFVQWAAAASRNPALKAIVPQVSPPMSAMRNLPYLYGAPMLLSNLWWLRIVAEKDADLSQMTTGLKNPEGLKTLPLSKVDDATFGRDLPMWTRWLQRDRASAWTGWNFELDLAKVTIPSLSISGYFDGDEIGTMLNWETRARAGGKDQWLVYGPWTHAFNTASKIGKVDFGDGAVLELDPVYLRFFDTYLKGKDVGWEKTPKVRAFVTGRNAWIESSAWPLADSRGETLRLLPRGSLAPAGPIGEAKIVFDPAKVKVPDAFKKPRLDLEGSLDFKRSDFAGSLLFRSEPLKIAKTIAGPIELDLAFRTSAASTDFFGIIVDEGPDGKMRAIGQPGVVRASYRDGDTPTALTPGKTYRATLRLWDFVHEFQAGHRIVLLVASDGFPTFARNLGTMDPIATATRMVIQRNTILLGGSDGSVLRYRVLPSPSSASSVSRTKRVWRSSAPSGRFASQSRNSPSHSSARTPPTRRGIRDSGEFGSFTRPAPASSGAGRP